MRRVAATLRRHAAAHLLAASLVLSARGATAEPVKLLTPEHYKTRVVAPKKGRAVLVNFWATWCEPCREEMPALVAAARGFKTKDVAVVLVSIDSLKTGPKQVPKFIAALKVPKPPACKEGMDCPVRWPFVSWLVKTPDPQDFINAVDRSWDGTIPYTLLYDRKGNVVQKLLGKQTETSFAAALQKAKG